VWSEWERGFLLWMRDHQPVVPSEAVQRVSELVRDPEEGKREGEIATSRVIIGDEGKRGELRLLKYLGPQTLEEVRIPKLNKIKK
jgi:hypothetical protein